MEQARATIQQATRNYAKRQMTWFRKDTSTRWFSGAGDDLAIQREIAIRIGACLDVAGRA
jgi:tRNA dimethylallyltransferase